MRQKAALLLVILFTITLKAGIGIGTSDAPLPVELTTFTASIVNNNVELNWETATEINNYGFEVERQYQESSIKNQDKNQSWETLVFIEGNGNSNSPKYYLYNDKSVSSGKYNYRLKQIDIDGTFSYSIIVEADLGLPSVFSLEQNYPNPFNPSTIISYSIPNVAAESSMRNVTLKIYDVLGNEISTLVNKDQPSGNYKVNFDASELSNGVYIYKIQSGSFVATKKMILLK
ncbi:MAG: T9SS type A sorting domain-containing protein [Melioribacteraceae bacterium]